LDLGSEGPNHLNEHLSIKDMMSMCPARLTSDDDQARSSKIVHW